jgi:hypothetical protein
VRWRAPVPAAGWFERDGDGGYAAVVVEAPPAFARRPATRLILAIDRSATVRGDGDAVERPLVRSLLDALGGADHVRVIGSDTIAWTSPAAARDALERAWSTRPAVFDLTRVLDAARPDGVPLVLVTDGLVADDPAALVAATRLGVPVHVIGIGPAPARATLRQLAAATGGTLRFAVPGDDLAALAIAVLADVATRPVAITINWGALAASDVEPALQPRLGAGQAMVVLARIRNPAAGNARVRGELFALEPLGPARGVDGATTAHGPLARRWARERIGGLVAGKHDRDVVTRLALRHGLVSPYTSLVAIGHEVVVHGGVKHSVAVPVAVPSGMQWEVIAPAFAIDTGGGAAQGSPATEARSESRAPAPGPPKTVVPPAPVAPAEPKPAPPPRNPPREAPAPARDPGQRASEVDDKRAQQQAGGDVDLRSAGVGSQRRAAAPASSAADPASSAADPASSAADPASSAADPASSAGDPAPSSGEAAERASERRSRAATTGSAAPASNSALDREDATAENTLVSATRRGWRLSASLGGGLAFDRGARGLAALAVRLESLRGPRLGGELALWLTGGTAEGRALITVARGGVARWLELGAGAGLQLGHATGVAGSLRWRAATPLEGLAGTLRYDAALLLTRPNLQVVHVITLGVELSY